MALENYRPIQFPEKTEIDNTDVVLIDSSTNGTNKYQLSRITAQASAEVAAAVAEEETARNSAISAAISGEVTARNAAIAANVDDTLSVSGKAADAKKTGDEIDDLKADLSNVITYSTQYVNRDSALSDKRYGADSIGLINGSGYTAIPAFTVPAGTYYFSDIIANFSHYVYSGETTIRNFSGSGRTSGTIILDNTATIYLTGNASFGICMFADNALPDVYIYGSYNVELKDGLVVINVDNTLTQNGIGADAKAVGDTLGIYGYQYIDESQIIENYRYGVDGSKTPTSATGYFILPAISLKSGTYYFRNIYSDFTAIENAETKARVSLKSLTGSGRLTGSVTIDYDCNVYITGNSSFDTIAYGKVLWADQPIAPLKEDRVYGIFGVRADSRRYREDVSPVFTVEKDGTGDFTTLKEAVEKAVIYPNAIIKVGKGIFDLIEEFGDDYFLNLEASGKPGLQLYNDITVEFTSDTLVTCHYTGVNDNVMRYFSPFNLNQNAGHNGGFTLKNLHLECSKVRYGIHDESDATSKAYRNQYMNCVIQVDNRENSAFSSRQCIGGGLGGASEIIIRDCVFESLVTEGTPGTGIVSYHNGGTGRSDIVIKDCYFKGNDTVKASWHGTSTKVSTMTVSGCSVGMAPYNQAEASSDIIENMELIAWNNDIRS